MQYVLWLAAITLLMLPGVTFNRTPLSVHGHVYTTAGRPVPGAFVMALPLDQSFGGFSPPFALTDQWGAYKLDLTYNGPQDIWARTQALPFPDAKFLTFNAHRQPTTSRLFTPGQSSNQIDFYLSNTAH